MNGIVHLIHWEDTSRPRMEQGIVGIFMDEIKANEIFDALEKHGDGDKTYYIDKYQLDEIIGEKK